MLRTGPSVQWPRRSLAWVGSRFVPHRTTHGLRLAAFSHEEDGELLLDKVTEALDLIAVCDPRRFARIRRQVRAVFVVPAGGEIYDQGLGGYMATASLLRQRSAAHVALAIVHEATHARLWASGIRSTAANLDRIERLCIAQEIAFAQRLPDAEALTTFARGKFERPWWAPEEGRRRADEMAQSPRCPHLARQTALANLVVGWCSRRSRSLASNPRMQPTGQGGPELRAGAALLVAKQWQR
jgi:hypothetical protein